MQSCSSTPYNEVEKCTQNLISLSSYNSYNIQEKFQEIVCYCQPFPPMIHISALFFVWGGVGRVVWCFVFLTKLGNFVNYSANRRLHGIILLRTNAPTSQGKLPALPTGVHSTEKSFHPAWPEEIWATSHPTPTPLVGKISKGKIINQIQWGVLKQNTFMLVFYFWYSKFKKKKKAFVTH